MNRLKFLAIAMAVIVASCATETADYDWCYVYDFYADLHGFEVQQGTWSEETALQSTDGALQFSYQYERFVQAEAVEISILKTIESVENTFDITAAGNIFGVGASFTAPFINDFEVITVPQDVIGQQGSSVNVTISAPGNNYQIASIIILGFGGSPFPRNDCVDLATPTPDTPTPMTPDPEDTEEPEITPDPDDPPEPFSLYDYDFKDLPSGQDQDSLLAAIPTGPYTITHEFSINGEVDGSPLMTDQRSVYGPNTIGWGRYVGSSNYRLLENKIVFNLPENFHVESVLIGWYSERGGLPPTINSVRLVEVYDGAILTGSATESGNKTNTAYFEWVGYPDSSGDRIEISQRFFWSFNGQWVSRLVIRGYWIDGDPVDPDETATPTPTATFTPLPTVGAGPTSTQIGGATWTPSPMPPEETEEAPADTSTPKPTWTPIPQASAFPSSTPDAEATEDAPFDYQTENEAEFAILGAIGDFFYWIQNAIANFFQFFISFFEWLGATIANLFALIGGLISGLLNLIANLFRFVLDVLEIIGLVIQIVLGIINLMIQWFIQMVGRLISLITTFFTVPATPLPGLPLCISEPLNHQICAVYWLLDWTIFAPGTLGSYIIPLMMIVVNILVIMRLVRIVFRLIRKGSSVVN